jgi:tetratricopeptide (TPR) repeat protein
MIRIKIISLLTFLIAFNAVGQPKTQQKLEKQFAREYCSCLENSHAAEPGKILYEVTETCIRSFFNNKGKEIEAMVGDRDWGSATLSDYEKGKVIGKEMIYNTIDDLVKDCKLYRESLSEYKATLMQQLKITRESADSSIVEFRSKEGMLKDEKSKATFFTLLAIMYEFVGNRKEALNAYDRSLRIFPTTQAKGLRLLLIKE